MNVSKVIVNEKQDILSFHNEKVHYLIEVLSERMHGKYSAALFDSAELSPRFHRRNGNGRVERITSMLSNKRNSFNTGVFFEWH